MTYRATGVHKLRSKKAKTKAEPMDRHGTKDSERPVEEPQYTSTKAKIDVDEPVRVRIKRNRHGATEYE